jgi:hypothetical protein
MPDVAGHDDTTSGLDGNFENELVARISKLRAPEEVYLSQISRAADRIHEIIDVLPGQTHLIGVTLQGGLVLEHQCNRKRRRQSASLNSLQQLKRRSATRSQPGNDNAGIQHGSNSHPVSRMIPSEADGFKPNAGAHPRRAAPAYCIFMKLHRSRATPLPRELTSPRLDGRGLDELPSVDGWQGRRNEACESFWGYSPVNRSLRASFASFLRPQPTEERARVLAAACRRAGGQTTQRQRISWASLRALKGIVRLGGNAVEDCGRLYDE